MIKELEDRIAYLREIIQEREANGVGSGLQTEHARGQLEECERWIAWLQNKDQEQKK